MSFFLPVLPGYKILPALHCTIIAAAEFTSEPLVYEIIYSLLQRFHPDILYYLVCKSKHKQKPCLAFINSPGPQVKKGIIIKLAHG
jgi:hypothetical protein